MPTSNIESLRKAGIACIVGALITAIGGAVSQVVQASTAVSDEVWRYPWSSEAFIPVTLLWALAHALVIVGILGFRRSGLAGPSRMAAIGLALALIGTALLFVGELAAIPIRDQSLEETGPATVGGVFGMGTLLSAIGLLVAGWATLRARLWRDWRRFTPLAAGTWALGLVGVASTEALPTGVAIYGLCLLALGVALYTRPSPEPTARPSAQLQGA